MVGFEALAVVGAIVGGLANSIKLVRAVRKGMKAAHGRERKHVTSLVETLDSANSQIQREYDRHHRRSRHRHIPGDDKRQLELQTQLIALQQVVIEHLQRALRNEDEHCLLSELDAVRLAAVVETVRERTISVLNSQHNHHHTFAHAPSHARLDLRMSSLTLSDPRLLVRSQPPNYESLHVRPPYDQRCSSDLLAMHELPASPDDYKLPVLAHYELPASGQLYNWRPQPLMPHLSSFCTHAQYLQITPTARASSTLSSTACPDCEWAPQDQYEYTIKFKDRDRRRGSTLIPIPMRFFKKSHQPGFADVYGCVLCARRGGMDRGFIGQESLVAHIEEQHSREEMLADDDLGTWSYYTQ